MEISPPNRSRKGKKGDESEAIIEYLQAELEHLRKTGKEKQQRLDYLFSREQELKRLETEKSQLQSAARDVVYFLCREPTVSEAQFYSPQSPPTRRRRQPTEESVVITGAEASGGSAG